VSEHDSGAEEPVQHRLDPDAAARAAPTAPGGSRAQDKPTPPAPPAPRPPVIDTRRYRWAIGGLGLILVLALSVYEFATRGIGTAGVTAGHELHPFSAPLATSNLEGDSNAKPPCTAARHDPRALNVCLLAQQQPLVLAFFVTGSDTCRRQVDVLQQVARSFPAGTVGFAAVAVKADHAETAKLVRSHGWTIPVAYDRDGTIGELYGVAVCPLLELAHRGGKVAERLIGEHWLTAAALRPHIRALAAGG
jgi:hypothetical protein